MNERGALDCGSGCRGFDPRHSPEYKRKSPGGASPLVPPGRKNRAGYSSDSVHVGPALAHALAYLVPRGRWAEVEARVYFIECNFELVKIGRTSNVHSRLHQLRTSSPYPLDVLAVVAGDAALEAAIHADLSEHRGLGEWFRSEGDLYRFLRSEAVRWAYHDPRARKGRVTVTSTRQLAGAL